MKRAAIAIGAGLAVTAGVIAASAASLGGLGSANLGAAATVVASCDTDGVNIGYTTAYEAGAPGDYVVTGVTVSSVNAACDGQNISVTLSDGTASLDSVNGVVLTGGSTTLALSAGANAQAVTGASVVISS
jgi:hypothetical protein